ncbi:MAG: hypothetical protein K2N90_11065 [Lachnospiraceae bacterium]|nr:hypothetical protein [Lachnospiraceae bacterium]
MKKFVVIMAYVLAVTLGLCACGASGDSSGKTKNTESSAASSITLKKDGSIESRLIVEGFNADYSEEGLENLIDASISAYQNQSTSSRVSLKSCRKDAQDRLVVEMDFNDSAAYAGWNNYFIDYMYASEMGMESGNIEINTDGFFAGTISDAYTAGYGLETTLTAASDNSSKQSVAKSDLLSMGDSHIVILERYDDEPIIINCYNDILYVGDGVTVTGKKSATIDAMDGYGIIVFQ